MKSLFWALGAFALAVLLSLALRAGEGYALIVLPPYRIEMSLVMMVVLAFAGFAAAYALMRIVTHTVELPGYVRAFRQRRRSDQANAALMSALQAWFEGRFSRAEKMASRAYDLGAPPAAVSLVAARAAQRVRNRERRDHWLGRAEATGMEWHQATEATRGELLVDDRRYAEARTVLRGLHEGGPTHIATLQLLMRAEQGLGDWEEVVRIARLLEKHSGLPPSALEGILANARVALLQQKANDPATLQEHWRAIPAQDRLRPRLAAAAARSFIQLGDCRNAHRIIEDALEHGWSTELALLYGECRDDDALSRLEHAERWLKDRPRDWPLLLTLGRLCVQRQLWGKAQSYLEASLAMQPTRAAHIALAQLFDGMGREQDANRHYRAAADVGLASGTGEF
jgi:HemY protein